ESAGGLDDVEDGGGERALRRSKGRHHLRSEAHVQERIGTDDTPVRERNSATDRTGPGYSSAGRVHRFADHGVDHGYVLHDAGPYRAGRCYRKTNFDWRITWAGRSDGSRPGICR